MDSPIRVLHVIGIMNRGGAETMIMNLYRNIDRTKVQFDFVENSDKPAAFDKEILSLGGRIFRCPHYNVKNHFKYCKWWVDFFAAHKNEYPIVHGHLGSTAAIYLFIAQKYGVFTIAHSHSASKGSIKYRIFSYPTRYIADHFFACSKDAATSRYGKLVVNNSSRFQILKNAIDTKKFVFNSNIRKEFKEKLQIPYNFIVIGHIGRFVEAKNHLFLLDIFENILKKEANAVLLLVGDGERRPEIEAYIKEKKIKNVILTGVKSNTWDYYQVMDVFLMPSLYEGLPVSLVEAQASGLPCCVSSSVPREAAITDLVQFRSLEDSAEQWADWALAYCHTPRRDRQLELQNAGYDISETARWLEKYYLEVMKSRG